MLKVAFTCLDKRIAPVFDTALQVHVLEIESGRIISEKKEILPPDLPLQKTLRLKELGIQAIVCGAISMPLQAIVTAYGIQVIPFVAGDLEEVIQAWLKGGLKGNAFAMPGCCGRSRRLKNILKMYKEEINMNGIGQGGKGGGRGQGGGMGGSGGRGQGRGGQGRGRISGPLAGGAIGTCVCPKCGEHLAHERGVPCMQRQCPKCGTVLVRE
jgi:predicted Fe-Mo cluster-binding NifX family protein